MEHYIPISWLNDFIFCPYSIYLHNVYNALDANVYYTTAQTKGKRAHQSIEDGSYSTHIDDLIGIEVYSDNYGLCGKIDVYHLSKQLLVERKRQIKVIYDGYRYQLYAQYFCLIEMGYDVRAICFHSLSDNRRYPVELPCGIELANFEKTIELIKAFSPDVFDLKVTLQKCKFCIYRELCDKTSYVES